MRGDLAGCDLLCPSTALSLDLPNDNSSHGCARLLVLVLTLLLATFKLFPVLLWCRWQMV